jgi:hypothetical protein
LAKASQSRLEAAPTPYPTYFPVLLGVLYLITLATPDAGGSAATSYEILSKYRRVGHGSTELAEVRADPAIERDGHSGPPYEVKNFLI